MKIPFALVIAAVLSCQSSGASTVIVDDTFADANIYQRDRTIVPHAVDWFRRAVTPIEIVPDDDVLQTPYAIKVFTEKSKDSPPAIMAHFPAVTLAAEGDFLELSLSYRANVHADNANSFFGIGLFHDGGQPTTADQTDSSDSYAGYGLAVSADGEPESKASVYFLSWNTEPRLRLTARGERIKIPQEILTRLSNANIGSKFAIKFRLTKTAEGLQFLGEIAEGDQRSEQFAISLPAEQAVLKEASFNTLGIGNTIDRPSAFTISNVRLIQGKAGE